MPVYLDWNATAPLSTAARAAWLAAQDETWGNPGSAHVFGQRARHRLDDARAAIAGALGCRAHELVLTSGGSECNATAIRAALAGGPGEIAASAIDHSSVLRNIAATPGATLRSLPVDGDGRLAPDTVRSALGATTRLLCLQFANNELGVLQDVPALVAAARAAAPAAAVLLDAAQGAGKRPLDLPALGVDYASIAGHKFGAPKGIGVLYVRQGAALPALIAGGRQQQDRRSGTEDSALASALAAALGERLGGWQAEDVRQRALLEAGFARIAAALPDCRWLARAAPRLANTLNLVHPGVVSSALQTRLDLSGFAVSTGAACMAARGDPSHVIAALGLEPDVARSAIRVSIGPATTAGEIIDFAAAYVAAVRALLGAA